MITLEIFDVEHGNCALLTSGDGTRMLIDCGHNSSKSWYPGTHLRRLGVSHLEMLVVTNYDQDHISGFPNLIDNVTIGNVVRNTAVTPHQIHQLKSEEGVVSTAMSRFITSLQCNFSPPGAGPAYNFPHVEWDVHRNNLNDFDDENNLSLVLRLKVFETNLIFPGDMEAAGWRRLLAVDQKLARSLRDTHVLVASHHGRENGICPEMFDVYYCNPQIVVISDDYRQYNTQYTTDYYRSKCQGILGFRGSMGLRHVLTTRRDGTITFQLAHLGGRVF